MDGQMRSAVEGQSWRNGGAELTWLMGGKLVTATQLSKMMKLRQLGEIEGGIDCTIVAIAIV